MLPIKRYGQCKRFCGQTYGQTVEPKIYAPRSIDAGHKKKPHVHRHTENLPLVNIFDSG